MSRLYRNSAGDSISPIDMVNSAYADATQVNGVSGERIEVVISGLDPRALAGKGGYHVFCRARGNPALLGRSFTADSLQQAEALSADAQAVISFLGSPRPSSTQVA